MDAKFSLSGGGGKQFFERFVLAAEQMQIETDSGSPTAPQTIKDVVSRLAAVGIPEILIETGASEGGENGPRPATREDLQKLLNSDPSRAGKLVRELLGDPPFPSSARPEAFLQMLIDRGGVGDGGSNCGP